MKENEIEGGLYHDPRCIRTNSGLYINVFEPTVDMLCIEDVAHGLSRMPRFGGQLDDFYTVAQHSLMCAQIANDEDKLDALMHDGSEAFILDMPTPIKNGLDNYKEVENGLMGMMATTFGFNFPLSSGVKDVDRIMLHFEWDHLVMKLPLPVNSDFRVMGMDEAKEAFLAMYHELKVK